MAAESHRESVSPKAELQKSSGFRSAMAGWKDDGIPMKERQKYEEVRHDTVTSLQSNRGRWKEKKGVAKAMPIQHKDREKEYM